MRNKVMTGNMNINLCKGIGKVKFGMKEHEVFEILGSPSKIGLDSDDNRKYLYYNDIQMRISIFQNYDDRVGYIEVTSDNTRIGNIKVMGVNVNDFIFKDFAYKLRWIKNEYDFFDVYSIDDLLVTIQSEFDKIIRFEMGTLISDDDEYIWDEQSMDEYLKKVLSNSVLKESEVVIEE
ncbi:MAG: hypothetical protein AAFY76_02975 [Cyanobacteria bacterium J06649_11]